MAAGPMPTRSVTRDPEGTRAALVDAAIESLVDVGYARTTGVEVCRRAELTRGALNHHFPDFADLLVAALAEIYQRLLARDPAEDLVSVVEWVDVAHRRLSGRESKAVIELWLASQNDPDIGARLAKTIGEMAALFRPGAIFASADARSNNRLETFLRMATETLIGLALGRATTGGDALRHEAAVVDHLRELARRFDTEQAGGEKSEMSDKSDKREA